MSDLLCLQARGSVLRSHSWEQSADTWGTWPLKWAPGLKMSFGSVKRRERPGGSCGRRVSLPLDSPFSSGAHAQCGFKE